MKHCFSLTLFLFSQFIFAQLKLVSWNIQNFGKSKTDTEIAFVANILKQYDVIAIQEVVAGFGGAQAVARLGDVLNRKGDKWDYVISDRTFTSSYKTERYAFLWKVNKLKIVGKPWLEKNYRVEIDREPFFCTFEYNKNVFTLVNFHAITKSKQPETEIKYFKLLPNLYPKLNLIFVGDFNCPDTHSVFNPLKKMGYASVFVNQKTTIKKKCQTNNCLASVFDNIWYNTSKVKVVNPKVIHFYLQFPTLLEAHKISDHIPITTDLYFY